MHIFLTAENEKFVRERMNELQCSGSDFVNSLLTAVLESGYTREYVIQLTRKDTPGKKIRKTIKMHRTSRAEKYDPMEY